MFKPHYILAIFLLIFCTMAALDTGPIVYRRLRDSADPGPTVTLHPVSLDNSITLGIVKKRVECVKENPIDSTVCEQNYRLAVNSIVSRENTLVTDMGMFLTAVGSCPQLYAECRSNQSIPPEECMESESLCLASACHDYWKVVSILNR